MSQSNKKLKGLENVLTIKDTNCMEFSTLFNLIKSSTFRVKIIEKSGIKDMSFSRFCEKMFHIDMVQNEMVVRCTFYDEACDKYYDDIQVNSFYDIKNISIKPVNKLYNNLDSEYEIAVNEGTTFTKISVQVDDALTASYTYTVPFTALKNIECMTSKSIVNVKAIISHLSDISEFNTKSTGATLKKLEVTLMDHELSTVKLVLWNKDATDFNHDKGEVLEIKNCRVGRFGVNNQLYKISSTIIKSDTTSESSKLLINDFKSFTGASHSE